MAGLDISMPGLDLTAEYGFPDYYGDLLVEAVNNGSIPYSRIEDMVRLESFSTRPRSTLLSSRTSEYDFADIVLKVARVWRYMFKLGQIDNPTTGDATAYVRTQAHLDLAQKMVEDGAVLLKNDQNVLPLASSKYSKIAVFGNGATDQNQVSENHGGFVIDSTMVVAAPLTYISQRGLQENITVSYAEAYPGTGQFGTIPPSMFKDGGVNVTYWTTNDFTGPENQTDFVSNITAATYPSELWEAWPQVFSARYEGVFLPNTSGTYHFSLVGQGAALLYLNNTLVANMSFANFGNTVQGIVDLEAGTEVNLRLKYSMGYSLSTGAYGVTLGVNVGNTTRFEEADALASTADVSIIFASDRLSEGADSGLGLSLPGDQDAVISRLAKLSKKTIVILNTNSAVLMPWIDEVDAVMEIWYPGQQVGLALESLLFGDISPSGKLPMTFPKSLNDTIQINSDIEVPFSEGLYVGYKSYDKYGVEPLFPFGHGLTYSNFSLSDMSVAAGANSSSVVVTSTLSNIGAGDARQVVQLYVGYPEAAEEPPKLLRAFEKVELMAGESTVVSMTVVKEDLNIWGEATSWNFVPGNYTFMLGFSAGDIQVSESVGL